MNCPDCLVDRVKVVALDLRGKCPECGFKSDLTVCDGCGELKKTTAVDVNESAPTDRGTEFRLMAYNLCEDCIREIK